jgi:hypothetical protein
MRLRVILLALTAAMAVLAPAAGDPQVRPARASDLPGLWQMMDLNKSASVDAEDSLFSPYQIFYFDPRGWMKYMTRVKPFTQAQLALFDAAPMATRYEVDKRGTLALTNTAWDEPRRYQCNTVTKVEDGSDPRAPRVGDLLLAATDAEGKLVWVKLLRKVP